LYALDFEYDGKLLSDFGFIICDFEKSDGSNMIDTGFNITFTKVSHNNGKSNSLVSTRYDQCFQTTFSICKDPYEYSDLAISNEEYRELVRWLNRNEFLKFRFVYDEEEVLPDSCYFNASFNIQNVKIDEMLYGLSLTMETDAPFGYGEAFEKTWTISSAGSSISFDDVSDEIGLIRPEITIMCGANCNLVISNNSFQSVMRINNCSNGETIHIDGDRQIISTTLATHKILNDFNFEFLCVGNNYNNRTNIISISHPCTFTLKYYPIIKDII